MPETSPIATETSAAPLTDAALLRLIGERRPEALGALHDRHAPQLLALARRILSAAGEAEDAVQDAFLHVWHHAAHYDPSRSSVSTWLVLLTRSRAIDRLRHRGVVDRAHESAHRQAPGDGHASPEGVESVFIRERRERVRRELDNLPPEQRQVLEMAFYDGLSQTEIAARADLPLGTVKTRTLLAMKKLRSALRAEIRQLL